MPHDLPEIAVFDIDGVLADVRHRLRFVESRPKDWDSFFDNMDDDVPLADGLALAREHVAQGRGLVFLTGRNESYRELTQSWLDRHGVPSGRLVMRPDIDRRPARLYKPVALREIARSATVVVVVDDDDAVVEVLRRDGWPVLHARWMLADAAQQGTLFDAQEVDGRA